MQVQHFHSWDVTPKEAIQIQQQLRAKVIPHGKVGTPNLIAGADVANTGSCLAIASNRRRSRSAGYAAPSSTAYAYISGVCKPR